MKDTEKAIRARDKAQERLTLNFEKASVLIRKGTTSILWLSLPESVSKEARGQYSSVYGDNVTFQTEITNGDWFSFCKRLGLTEVTVIDDSSGKTWIEKL